VREIHGRLFKRGRFDGIIPTMPTEGHETLMLLPGHYTVIREYCDSLPTTTSMFISRKVTPKEGPAPQIVVARADNLTEVIDFCTWLLPKGTKPGKFEDITLPDWSMRKLEKCIKAAEKSLDESFPRKGIGLKNPDSYKPTFSYRAGVWLLLALEQISEGYVSKWVRNHPEFARFKAEAAPIPA
jgi:hypothetical protein